MPHVLFSAKEDAEFDIGPLSPASLRLSDDHVQF